MLKNILFYIFLFCIPYVVFCQEDSLSCDTYAWIDFDNDLFFKTDRYYTNGVVLGFIHPVIKRSPFHVLWYTRGENMLYYSGLSITQEMYTPTDTDTKEFQAHDRPYAGTLFATQFADVRYPNKNRKIYTAFSLGVIGPGAGTQETQSFIHRITPSPDPMGWDNQVQNGLLINYTASFEQGIINKKAFLWAGDGFTDFGNYKTNVGVGTFLRFGKYNDYYLSLPVCKSVDDWQVYGQIGASSKFVMYDATLQGVFADNLIRNTYSIERLVGVGFAELTLAYKKYLLQGKVTLITPEFEGGGTHKYFSLSFGVGF
jgi:lipid A 3-O-deacylase